MDITETLAPTSDQLDAVDLIGGPRMFTITEVRAGSAEQPVAIVLAEFPRVWRPGKSMRRVLAMAWGVETAAWVGRRVRLYCDPRVKFGGQAVGGTRIEALSHLDGPVRVPLLVTRGKSAVYVVQPLPDEPVDPPSPTLSADEIDASTDVQALRAAWRTAGPQQRERIEQRVTALTAPTDGGDPA